MELSTRILAPGNESGRNRRRGYFGVQASDTASRAPRRQQVADLDSIGARTDCGYQEDFGA